MNADNIRQKNFSVVRMHHSSGKQLESVIQNMRLMTERYTNCWEDWTECAKNKSNWNRE